MQRLLDGVKVAGQAAVLVALLSGCSGDEPVASPADPDPGMPALPAAYVGGATCSGCHESAYTDWQGSHHDFAMQMASEETVLGNFDQARFDHGGLAHEFFRRDGGFWIRTDGADGALADFRITHTFGVDPLQQYLVEFPDGRFQVSTLAWDSRPAADGGQRWFSVHADEPVAGNDPLHWTGVFQNWNTSCATCHSTNVRKNYSPADDTYETTYSSIDVDCEACHGPGSLHAEAPSDWPLVLAADDRRWSFAPGDVIAARNPPRESAAEIETCAQCHSRRGQLTEPTEPGRPLMHAFRPSLLDSGLYHADGQILDEVYVYGSFLQSAMYAAGVTCSDCHDPHSNQLKADGNAVCAQCHLASAFETRQHHRHPADTACVDCHMPAKTYMVVDPRRDHSFRVPRPDLGATTGAPDACTGCHAGRSTDWAAATLAEWYPDGRSGSPHYGTALAAGRDWQENRDEKLAALVSDAAEPAIARATALSLLTGQPPGVAADHTRSALDGAEPLLQLAAIDAADILPAPERFDRLLPFLTHPSIALRTAAARRLAALRRDVPQARRATLDAALDDYREVQRYTSDRPESFVNLAALDIDLGNTDAAESSLNTAISRFPWFAASYINLADLWRRSGRDSDALALLEAATQASPGDAGAWLASGLARVRAGQTEASLTDFRRAVELAPGDPYYRYVLGIALNSTGSGAEALAVLDEAHGRFPAYRDITFALATLNRDAGNIDAALGYARKLEEADGSDPGIVNLVRELESRRP